MGSFQHVSVQEVRRARIDGEADRRYYRQYRESSEVWSTMDNLTLFSLVFMTILAGLAESRGDTTQYAEIPTLVVIYTDYYNDSDTYMRLSDGDVEALKAEVEIAVEFFWRSSNLKCHVRPEYLVVERELTPEQMWFWGTDGGCWMPWWSMDGVTSVRADVLAAGYQAGDIASVVAFYAFQNDDDAWQAIGGGAYGMDCGVLGHAGYVGIPLCWGIDSMENYMIHEYLHELDSMFDSSGNPDDMFHADHADQFPYPDYSGRHFNFLISQILDPQSWLQLYSAWATIRTVDDSDGDGIPDDGDLPITEESLGTAADNADTDDDGLSDLEELVATYHSAADPLSRDSDGDGVRDGDDRYPLYRLSNTRVACGTPVLDGVIGPDEYVEVARFHQWEPDVGAVVHVRWTEDAFYFAAEVTDEALVTWFTEPELCDHFEVLVNSDRDDWFIDDVPGNYRFMFVPTGEFVYVHADDYYLDPDGDNWHEIDPRPGGGWSEFTDDGYVIEAFVPLAVLPALEFGIGQNVQLTFNVVDIDDWEWPCYNVFSGLIGDMPGFVEVELTTAHADITGDGAVNLSDLAELVSHYGKTSGATYGEGDLDDDGDVDLADLGALLSEYGTTCG